MVADMISPAPAGTPVPSDFQDHKNRRPPSTEPGTDYATAYGTSLVMPFDGRVWDVKTSNTGAMGRVVFLVADDGTTWIRLLHLSAINVRRGQMNLKQGEHIALSGASANGSDHGVGSHVHTTLWINRKVVPTPGITPPVDFQLYVRDGHPAGGGGTPINPTPNPTISEGPIMTGVFCTNDSNDKDRSGVIVDTESGLVSTFGDFSVAYANGVAAGFGLPKAGVITRGHYNKLMSDVGALKK
jgi:hypothetical protein